MKDRKQYHREYREKNQEKLAAYRREWREKNKEKKAEYDKEWSKVNKEKKAEYARKYSRENRDKIAKRKRERRREEPAFRLEGNLRTRLGIAIRDGHGRKCGSTLELTGCTWAELRSHLESQFTDGMTWDNYGEWHVDHIKPCTRFNLLLDTEQRDCFHYSNLQPLWASENLSKSDKYDEPTAENNQ